MITIRFVSHPGVFNWGTARFQNGFWPDHVDAVLPDGRMLGAHADGVQILPADYDTGRFVKELRIPIIAYDFQAKKFYDFLMAQVGKPYDGWSMVAFAFERDWQLPNSWFCSELIAAALAECGIFPHHLAIGFNRITLRDLMLIISTITETGNG